MTAEDAEKIPSKYLTWKKDLLPVQCIDGYFLDAWLGVRTKFEILGVQRIEFDIFLPLSDDSHTTKTVKAEIDGKPYGDFEIIRGATSKIEIHLTDDALHILDLVTEKEPWGNGDVRDLGFVCVRLEIDSGQEFDLDAIRAFLTPDGMGARVESRGQDNPRRGVHIWQTPDLWGGLLPVENDALKGWLFDLTDSERDLDLRCLVNGTLLDRVAEFQARDSLLDFGVAAASRSFRFELPEELLDGQFHEVNFAIGAEGTPILDVPYSIYLEPGMSRDSAVVEPLTLDVMAHTEPFTEKQLLLRLCQENLETAFYMDQLTQRQIIAEDVAGHYFETGWKLGLDPTIWFSTTGYLALNPDVEEAGINPFIHYLTTGRHEGRQTMLATDEEATVQLADEWAGYKKMSGIALFPWEHGKKDLEAVDFTATLLGQDPTEALAEMKLPAVAKAPTVSIIIPCIGQDVVTAECLKSIERAWPSDFDIEIVIADNASPGPFYKALGKHASIRTKRFKTNIGFGPACNRAADAASGEFLLFLNNDCQLAPGAIEALRAVFDDDTVGVTGPKILSFNGTLQEAGVLINSDGTGRLIGHGCNPDTPRFNYPRPVEHVSGAAYMMRRDLFLELGGFDPIFAPAYCEDADLSLKVRERGLKIWYEPAAVVAHHLSKSTSETGTDRKALGAVSLKDKLIPINRQKLVTRWNSTLCSTDLRTIALYLPQYHPIPQNDLWWGKGFTEWTNVTRARPNYEGQNQPRYPTELGYYDLRVPEVMQQQAQLAKRHGIHGFCYYYYWFDGERVLEAPLERMLASGSPDMPFCLCWANENWTRRWDGSDQSILLKQSYREENYISIMQDMARYLKDDRYIRINGRPLVLIYRIKEIANPRRMTEAWRHVCRAAGVGEICIGLMESFELCPAPEPPKRYGCDIAVEFPAHGMANDEPMDVVTTNPTWKGRVHDYTSFAAAFMKRPEPAFKRIRSVLVGWDNTPRHGTRSLILENATPGAFQAWLEWAYRRTMEQNQGDERLVFINAWNEWGEGSYLEPDERFGRGYLQAVENALESARRGGQIFAV